MNVNERPCDFLLSLERLQLLIPSHIHINIDEVPAIQQHSNMASSRTD